MVLTATIIGFNFSSCKVAIACYHQVSLNISHRLERSSVDTGATLRKEGTD